ncbi:ankyrin repeat domain-containing protein [Halogeometricum borinquense]|uniref:Ankyrin repeat domain-containing protein n=1 Tax=Halogeometricum borinquense TaxID=60847 RepID=A0A6C0UH01_9EURY|nr:ankyrin repeat domain-containing protein [Halogeometricum borinquense]QIB74487.1 ankyrin repeat domain-containing protein [Halogeometricum borinquense]
MTDIDDIYQHSDLETAIIQDDLERFHELIGNVELDHRSDNGGTLLHKAASVGNDRMVEELLNHGITPDIQNQGGKTALHLAVDEGLRDVIETLVVGGADPNIQDNSGTVPILKLIYRGDVELATLMIENGADPEIETNGGVSPLDIAKDIDATEVVEVLKS